MNDAAIPENVYRILFAAAFLLNMTIVSRYRKKAQSGETFDLTNEPPWMRYGLRGTALVLLGYMLTYVTAPSLVEWSRVELPAWPRLAGALYLFLLMPWLLHWTQRSLGRNVSTTVIIRADHELVTSGPYRWVRHPLYVLGTLLYLSLSLIAASWFLMAGLVLGLILILLRTPKEEAMLAEHFGDAYRDYERRTGRFFPKLFQKADT